MGDKPAIHVRQEVTTSNRELDFGITAAAGTPFVATLTTGWYEDVFAYCAQVQAQMRAVVPAPYDTTIVVEPIFPGDGYGTGYHGNIRINLGGAGSLNWFSGPNAANSCGADLGFDTSADDSGASAFISDWQALHCWLSEYAPGEGTTRDSPELVGSDLVRVLSGKYSKRVVVGASRCDRQMNIVASRAAYVYEAAATGSLSNRAFETAWRELLEDEDKAAFRLFDDQEDSGSYETYYLVAPTRFAAEMKRVTKGIEYYDWTLMLNRQES